MPTQIINANLIWEMKGEISLMLTTGLDVHPKKIAIEHNVEMNVDSIITFKIYIGWDITEYRRPCGAFSNTTILS